MTTTTIEDLEDDLVLAKSQIPDTMEKARKHYSDFLDELTDKIEDDDADAQRALKAELDQLQQLIVHYQAWVGD